MQKYVYSKQVIYLSIILPALFMLGLFLWAVYGLIHEGPLIQYKLLAYTMPVLILSAFLGLHNPSSITITKQSIIFAGFGRQHQYSWEEINEGKVKNFDFAGKALIRIGKPRIFGGRYWITNQMSGYNELLLHLKTKFPKEQ